jgi:hypothetical protein
LPETNPALDALYRDALRSAGASSAFLRHGGRFPLAGRGDINTYSVFAELAANAINPVGRAGLILPTGIATDDTTKLLFGALVRDGRLAELVGFENEEHVFPAVHHSVTFCKLAIGGTARPVSRSHIAFRIRRYSQLVEDQRFYWLQPCDFALLNPNTGTCPIFRTQADAELTKAIYRRVPILWLEANGNQAEANPWRLSFSAMFHMANDSHLFRTAGQLTAEGCWLEGSVFVGAGGRCLPLYEAKLLHQFDHRYSTYEGATQSQLNVGILPRPSPEQKRDPDYGVQPRYWVREDLVGAAMPRWPEPLAKALAVGSSDAIRYVLLLWTAGFFLEQNCRERASPLLKQAMSMAFTDTLPLAATSDDAQRLQREFPITEADAEEIIGRLEEPRSVAADLIERFSPKWLIGWRDICRANDERTLIASALPKAAVGHTFPLAFCPGITSQQLCGLLAAMNAFVTDYATRQKVGGTHITYTLLNQLPLPGPDALAHSHG